jgi:MYXO-CTERM domain-containing protein
MRERGRSSDSSSADDSAGEPVPDTLDAADPDELPSNEEPDSSEIPPPVDAEATDSIAEEEEDEAADEEFGFCFPEFAPCDSDSDCQDGWICAELEETPPSWGDVERACLPPAIAAALDGDLEVEGGQGAGESSDTSADGAGLDDEGLEPVERDEDTADVAEVMLGTQGGSEGSAPKDGCSFGSSPGRGSAAWYWGLVALGLSAVLRRRRIGAAAGRTVGCERFHSADRV